MWSGGVRGSLKVASSMPAGGPWAPRCRGAWEPLPSPFALGEPAGAWGLQPVTRGGRGGAHCPGRPAPFHLHSPSLTQLCFTDGPPETAGPVPALHRAPHRTAGRPEPIRD